MKSLLRKIEEIGITDETPFHLRNKLRVFNNANLVVFFVSIFYFAISVVNGFYISMIVTGYSFVSNAVSLILAKKGFYRFVFHYSMWYGFFLLTAFTLMLGKVNNSYLYFLFMPVVCNIFFDSRKTTIFYLLISMLMMVFNLFYMEHYEPYYKKFDWMELFTYPNVLFASLLVYFGVRLFKQENMKYAKQIEEQKEILEVKNTEITDSINYAKRIQSALIPAPENFTAHFRDAFVLFQPKDIVSGDFYWIAEKNDQLFFVAADCTGHGVPGGFMTMLGISFLDEIINKKETDDPAEILNQVRDRIILTLKQTGTSGENKDGMDIVVCRLDKTKKELLYAGANNALYILSGKEMKEYKGDKQPCGFYHEIKPFTQHRISVQEGDSLYMYSDGYPDQFGGPKGKKFKYKQLEELLVKHSDASFSEQKNILSEKIGSWKGKLEQVDDILVIGIKI